MSAFQTRLFFRIISKSREVYALKVVTLAISFACSTLIILFSLNEFGYDRFHRDYHAVFRVLQKDNNEWYTGNRLSNRIPPEIVSALNTYPEDSILLAQVKVMDEVSIVSHGKHFHHQKVHAAGPSITEILSFSIVHGSLPDFHDREQTVLLASSAAVKFFGTIHAAGETLQVYTLGDTVHFSVAAVYKDYPNNSQEQFNTFIRFDTSSIRSLKFNYADAGVYGKLRRGEKSLYEGALNRLQHSDNLAYILQPISEIYFGPRVLGEDARHGDRYSIIILICITVLILFFALTSFINLTTLTLPYRSKELAIKKLAGTSQEDLIIAFAKESCLVVGSSLVLGILLLVCTTSWIRPILSVDLISLLFQGNMPLLLSLAVLFLIMATGPLFMTLRFARATPNRLLSTDTITFPRFKRIIMFLQLGISIFLIVSSLVIRRQISYSLVKEPGRNHDQVVYVTYPNDLTNEGLASMREAWKKINANIVDIMATSQLPDRISSKELGSEFYFISVDRGFKDFFDLQMVEGNWFKANDGDSISVINEEAWKIPGANASNVIGVFRDLSGQFNLPEKPVRVNVAPHFNYNFLCIRILEVDIRRTVRFLETHFGNDSRKADVSFFNRRFEEWLKYQDRLNTLSAVLAVISALLSCCAIYGLSISIVRDKLKQIAIHKLCGANTFNIARILAREFADQLLLAILIFGPLTYLILQELLRSFVYVTGFNWLDPLLPLTYCAVVIAALCGLQALSLNRKDLSASLKG